MYTTKGVGMQIICISRGTFAGGKELAEKLAAKLGYDCMSREELTDAATGAGIPIGKLETAIVRRRPIGEQLAVERERYRAFVAATLCERAFEKNLVYHGRTGHLVMPGVTGVLRIRAILEPEQRTRLVMDRLKVNRDKARRYLEQVDEDRRRWVRTLYNVDWQNPHHYDAVVNLSHLGVDNASQAMIAMAQLPEFQITPATRRMLDDLLLASRCRLAIGADQRTRDLDVQVNAERGHVSVTYLPRQERAARTIPEVLKRIEGVEEIVCTMASTNILWIQERFDPQAASMDQILEIAGKWSAAVEMVRLIPGPAEEHAEAVPEQEAGGGEPEPTPEEAAERPLAADNGGILDDTAEEEAALDDPGLRQTRERLIEAGHAGAYRVVRGGAREVIGSMERNAPYSLVIVGNLYQSKGEAARKRLSREMVGLLNEKLRLPVIGAEELKSQYLFGPAQWIRMLVLGAIAALMAVLVFGHQKEILELISREGTLHRIGVTVAILAFVPVFAYTYGNFSRMLLRLFKFE